MTSPQRKIGVREFVPTFATGLAIQAFTVVQGIVLARVLGPEGRGQFAAAIMWPSFFAIIGLMGVNVVLARRAAKSDDLPRLERTALWSSLITGLATMAVCGTAQAWWLGGVDPVVKTAAFVFMPFIFFNHLALCLTSIDHGAGHFHRLNLTRMLVNPVYLVLVIASILAGRVEVVWFVGCLMAATACVALFRLMLSVRSHGLRGDVEPLGPLLREAWPFGMTGLIGPLLQTADKALLLYLLGARDLGIYTVALAAASVVGSAAAASGTVGFGMAAQAGIREGFEPVARLFRLVSWIWILGGIAAGFALPFLVPLVYGGEFASAVVPAVALLLVVALTGQSGLLDEALRAQGRAFVGIKGRVAGLSVLLVLGAALAPVWGVMGVVVASILAQLIVLIVFMLAAKAHFHEASLRTLCPGLKDAHELWRHACQKFCVRRFRVG